MCVFPLCAVLPRLIPLCCVVVCLSLFSFLLLLDALLIPVFFCLDTLWGKDRECSRGAVGKGLFGWSLPLPRIGPSIVKPTTVFNVGHGFDEVCPCIITAPVGNS